MTEWRSPDDLWAEFLPGTPIGSSEALRHELRAKLAEVHPDKTGGYRSSEQEARCLRLTAALEYMNDHQVSGENSEARALVPFSEIRSLVDATTQPLVKAMEQLTTMANINRTQQIEQMFRTSYSLAITHRYRPFKITSATVGVLSAGLFAFWSQLSSNEVLSPLSRITEIRVLWLMLVVISAGFFVMTWLSEQMAARHIEFLLSEDGLSWVVRGLLLITDYSRNLEFTRRELVNLLIVGQLRRRVRILAQSIDSLLPQPGRLPLKSAGECADMLLEKLMERKVVSRVDKADVDEWYRISQNVVEGNPKFKHLVELQRDTSTPLNA